MAIDYEYRCGDKELRIRPSAIDLETMSRLHPHLTREIDLIRIRGIDVEERVGRQHLLAAVEQTIAFIHQDSSVLPCTYQFLIDEQVLPAGMAVVWNSGTLSGLSLLGDDGVAHELETGIDKCTLTVVEYLKNDKSHRVTKDIKDLDHLKTRNAGIVRIRAARSVDLLGMLKELDTFLSHCRNDTVIKHAW
jgi:hypothetical protein